MNRTLKGFLKEYCRELSGLNTSSLRRLVRATANNPRVVEPLFVLAAIEGKTEYLLALSEGMWFHDDYKRLAKRLERTGSIERLLESKKTPARYAAVLDAYHAQWDVLEANRRTNGLLRPRILEALEQSGTTRYRLCRDLELNPGNVYAYLAGDDAKVSNETAQQILRYAETGA